MAAADAFSEWYRANKSDQTLLFQPTQEFFETWRKVANGGGFCELARVFFSKLTVRYLNYFLERAASEVLPSVERREAFKQDLARHLDDISRHAFETSKITQSFAAGWFNKNTKSDWPSDSAIQGFLHVAFGKLEDEIRREEQA